MKRKAPTLIIVRTSDRRSVSQSIFWRKALFRKAITAEDVRAGIRPKKAA